MKIIKNRRNNSLVNCYFLHKSYRMQERGECMLLINSDIYMMVKRSVCCFSCKRV